MKYFRFWVEEKVKISIDQRLEEIKLVVGSNLSKEAAAKDALIQAKKIEGKIAGDTTKEEYDVAIKEHVSDVVDKANVVTVCRYGAYVLNTTQYTVLDLDDYPVDFLDIFRSLKKLSKKERIVYKFEQRIKRYPFLGNDFRIYETAKGIRVIGKKYIDPTDNNYSSLMRKLNVDWLYIQLSKKQKCYRARISPKPYRMKAKTIKIKSPLDCEKEEYLAWVKEYERKSEAFSVVRLIKTIGQDFSHENVIKKHDHACNMHKNARLV